MRAATQAQAAAAERAAEAAQNVKQLMEQSPPRIRLDVEMAAPTIIVPQKSTSLDAIVVDLGKYTFSQSMNIYEYVYIFFMYIPIYCVCIDTCSV